MSPYAFPRAVPLHVLTQSLLEFCSNSINRFLQDLAVGPKLEVRFNHKLPCPSKAGMPRWKRLPNKPLEWAKSNKALDSASAASVCVCVSGTNVPHLSRSSCSCPQLASHSTSLPSTILAVATSTMRHETWRGHTVVSVVFGCKSWSQLLQPFRITSARAQYFLSATLFLHAARAIAFSCNTETSCNSQLAVVLPA